MRQELTVLARSQTCFGKPLLRAKRFAVAATDLISSLASGSVAAGSRSLDRF